jgi:phosphinothricin acetyltransferase
MMIRPALPGDAEDIARIYNHYILNTVISFEEQVVPPQAIQDRLQEVQAASLPWLVAESSGSVIGYAYASRWKERSAYRYSVESAIYLDPAARGVGHGTRLYTALLTDLRQRKVHTVIGGIALPNPASVRLHEKFGFQKVAHFKEVGYKFGQWVDVGYWQLIFLQA